MSIETNINREKSTSKELWLLKKQLTWENPVRKERNGRTWLGNPEHRNGYSYDKDGFVKWNYPFADIINPYTWVKTYNVTKIPKSRILPNISYKDLKNTWLEWPTKKLTVKNFSKDTITDKLWVKLNNPCDLSCGKNDVHAIWLKDSGWAKAWDWQILAKYESPIHWLASHMKYIRDYKLGNNYLYRDRSIQGIICNWLQWFYKDNEDKSLKALRLIWISDACNKINKNSDQKIEWNDRIDTMDKETLMAFTQLTAQNETWCQFTRRTLEKAYKLAFG